MTLMSGGTIAEVQAYLFGERMIRAQARMLLRNQASLDALLNARRGSDERDARRHVRQLHDYRNRFAILNAHRDVLVALAERSRASVQ